MENPDFETLHQGNYSVCFSSYAISNRYDDQAYFLGDPEIHGESKILYQLYFSENGRQSINIVEIPIVMEGSMSSQTLEISQIQGFLDPLEAVPWDGSQLSDRLTILQQTVMQEVVAQLKTSMMEL